MYRSSIVVAALFFVIGCQQEMPNQSTALADSDITQTKEEVAAFFDNYIQAITGQRDINQELNSFSSSSEGMLLSGTGRLSISAYREIEPIRRDTAAIKVLRQELEDLNTDISILSPTSAMVIAAAPTGSAHMSNDSVVDFEWAALFVLVKEAEGWKIHTVKQTVEKLESP